MATIRSMVNRSVRGDNWSRKLADTLGYDPGDLGGIPAGKWLDKLGHLDYSRNYLEFRSVVFDAVNHQRALGDGKSLGDDLLELNRICPSSPLRFLSLVLFSLAVESDKDCHSTYRTEVWNVMGEAYGALGDPLSVLVNLSLLAMRNRGRTASNPSAEPDAFYASYSKPKYAEYLTNSVSSIASNLTASNLTGNQIMTNTVLFNQVTVTTINGRNADTMSMAEFIDAVKGAEERLSEINRLRDIKALADSAALAAEAVELLEGMQKVVKVMDEKFAEKK